ncbi:hypothetical protein BU16DRAFT_522892 [Lophium mytilinum]|uniref:BTB domain-containing protein n=1 Tax=Lophium mytilinum TaxID=390894 RepID=A0A6A6R6R4_9PEZI|nr:hypothetical protein BU16DRAFT_522892 [Lophium mytilinum]
MGVSEARRSTKRDPMSSVQNVEVGPCASTTSPHLLVSVKTSPQSPDPPSTSRTVASCPFPRLLPPPSATMALSGKILFRHAGLRKELLDLMTDRNAVQIEVVVGTEPNTRTWFLYESLLCSYSDFFRAALQGGFKEAKEKRVALPEEDPEVFELFVQWLFTGGYIFDDEIVTRDAIDDMIRDGEPYAHASVLRKSAQAWVFGEKIRSSVDFKNYAMNYLYQMLLPKKVPLIFPIDPAQILLAFQHTADGSCLRRFFMDYLLEYVHLGGRFCWDFDGEGWKSLSDEWKTLFDCKDLRDSFLNNLNAGNPESGIGKIGRYFESRPSPTPSLVVPGPSE